LIDKKLLEKIKKDIIEPTLKGMEKENNIFRGVLFCGLMIAEGNPYVLEFNVRFGDPECEVLMPLLKTPPSLLFYKCATGKLKDINIEFENKYAVGVVLASSNYPFKKSKPASSRKLPSVLMIKLR